MKKSLLIIPLFIAAITIIIFSKNSPEAPEGWFAAGNKPSEYDMGTDNSIYQNGTSSAFIKSKSPGSNEFGTLMQTISAENYVNKRMRLSGYIKSDNVKGWCGMWMRIDGSNHEQLGFDNMGNRPVKGTTDWNQYEIVLDIPSGSETINYGVLLGGDGEIWFDNLKLEEVDKNVPVTSVKMRMNLSSEPVNMDFEK